MPDFFKNKLLLRLLTWLVLAGFVLLLGVLLLFFGIHALQVLTFGYPLDYGEGPLLAQVAQLRAGVPPWRLYADPAAAPYLVVNYPPVYPTLVAAVAAFIELTGARQGPQAALLAGRLVSLLAALGCALALWRLAVGADWETSRQQTADRRQETGDRRQETGDRRQETADSRQQTGFQCSGLLSRVSGLAASLLPPLTVALLALAFLALPIVREWAVVLRVDMLGVALGLWALVLLGSATHGGIKPQSAQSSSRRAALACAASPAVRSIAARAASGFSTPRLVAVAFLLIASLFTKPSLIAAPLAGVLWLLWRDWRRGVLLGGLLALGGGLLLGVLQLASGGWFWLHVVTANANAWQAELARGFWLGQLAIHWPLGLAALVGLGIGGRAQGAGGRRPGDQATRRPGDHVAYNAQRTTHNAPCRLAILYTLFGAVGALGVGKVGAYLNYFLEFYAGLIWLAALGGVVALRQPGLTMRLAGLLILLLTAAGLLRFYPQWSEEYLKPYGLIEGKAPPRLVVGQYGIWQDLQREQEVLAALTRVNTALVALVQSAKVPIVSDTPALAAQAGQLSLLQAFEHRQLYDVDGWDQRPLLRAMANGQVPLVVLDYLGNWLTPEMIAVITHRYAQEGSRGFYDLYRPLEVGTLVALAWQPGNRLLASGYRITPPIGANYAPGETVLLTLEVQGTNRPVPPQSTPSVGTRATVRSVASVANTSTELLIELRDANGRQVAQASSELLYGALSPGDLAATPVQHLQPLPLPPGLAAGRYELYAELRTGGQSLAQAYKLTDLVVGAASGRSWGRFGYYVPAPLVTAWGQFGGAQLLGEPQMPAVPLAGGWLQCFARGCLRLQGGIAERLPLGELVGLGTSGWHTSTLLDARFVAFWQALGGEATLGPPVSAALPWRDRLVQYSRYARLELPANGPPRLAELGAEYLRLPNGGPYRWPVAGESAPVPR